MALSVTSSVPCASWMLAGSAFPTPLYLFPPTSAVAVSVPTVWAPIRFSPLQRQTVSPAQRRKKLTPHSNVKPGEAPLMLGPIGHGALSSLGFSPSSAELHAPHQQDPAPRDHFSLSHGPSPVALHPLLFPGGEDASP